MDWVRDALAARKQRELTEQWLSVGQALVRLAQNRSALNAIPPEAAWTVLNGLHEGLQGMDRVIRAARRFDLPAEARQALGEISYALGSVTDLLERYGVPQAENLYGLSPPETRWQMGPIRKGDDVSKGPMRKGDDVK